jgi:hypothetical protein
VLRNWQREPLDTACFALHNKADLAGSTIFGWVDYTANVYRNYNYQAWTATRGYMIAFYNIVYAEGAWHGLGFSYTPYTGAGRVDMYRCIA